MYSIYIPTICTDIQDRDLLKHWLKFIIHNLIYEDDVVGPDVKINSTNTYALCQLGMYIEQVTD